MTWVSQPTKPRLHLAEGKTADARMARIIGRAAVLRRRERWSRGRHDKAPASLCGRPRGAGRVRGGRGAEEEEDRRPQQPGAAEAEAAARRVAGAAGQAARRRQADRLGSATRAEGTCEGRDEGRRGQARRGREAVALVAYLFRQLAHVLALYVTSRAGAGTRHGWT